MYYWFIKEIRKIGYQGLVSHIDYDKNLGYTSVRNEIPVISMHGYFAHPSEGQVLQSSSIDSSGSWWYIMAGTRFSNKPFMITEYGRIFWNHYRYEEGFLIAGYRNTLVRQAP